MNYIQVKKKPNYLSYAYIILGHPIHIQRKVSPRKKAVSFRSKISNTRRSSLNSLTRR